MLYVHGAWWLRPETLKQNVLKVERTLESLGRFHGNWSRWFACDGEVETELAASVAIEQRFRSSFSDILDGVERRELGFRLACWSLPRGKGLSERSAFNVRCCSKSQYSGYNILSLSLPDQANPTMYEAKLLGDVLVRLAVIWDPDWLRVWDLKTKLPEPWPPLPELGWINYLPTRTGVLPRNLPNGWKWHEGSGQKRIFIHDEGPPDAKNPDHVSAFARMGELIQWTAPPDYYQNWKAGKKIE